MCYVILVDYWRFSVAVCFHLRENYHPANGFSWPACVNSRLIGYFYANEVFLHTHIATPFFLVRFVDATTTKPVKLIMWVSLGLWMLRPQNLVS